MTGPQQVIVDVAEGGIAMKQLAEAGMTFEELLAYLTSDGKNGAKAVTEYIEAMEGIYGFRLTRTGS